MKPVGWIRFAIVLALAAAPVALAGEPSKTPPRPKGNNVLDFEADVIEGDRKAPELFLQTDVQRPALDTILYQRADFNDFHAVDSRLRPRLGGVPKGKTSP
jgi:hypothetical protein